MRLVSSVCGATAYLLLPQATWAAPLLWVIGTRVLYRLHIPTYNITVVGLRQAVVPDQMRGRVNAATRIVGFGALSIGPLPGGGAGCLVGPAPTVFLPRGKHIPAVIYTPATALAQMIPGFPGHLDKAHRV